MGFEPEAGESVVQCLILQGNKATVLYQPLSLLTFWTNVRAMNSLHQMWSFETVDKEDGEGEESKNRTWIPISTVNTNVE